MFYNLKIAIRNLRRNGLYSVINVAGLTVGLTACILIMLWVQDELSFDKFHKRSNDIYQVNLHFKWKESEVYWPVASAPLAFTAKDEIPQIENACRYYSHWEIEMLKYKGKEQERVVTNFNTGMVDTTFFSIFDFKVLEGNVASMLVDPHSIVLSKSISKQLFGDDSPIGKTLFDSKKQSYQITGLIADMPSNSSIRFDVILPFSLYENSNSTQLAYWERFDFRTWFLLRPNTDVSAMEKKLTEMQNHHSKEQGTNYSLQSIEQLNFYNADGSAKDNTQAYNLFSVIAIVVILIACVNFVNISTARASRRNKEVFVKNILGARKWNLFFSFLNESAVLFLLALFITMFFIPLVFPAFNHIAGKQLEFNLLSTDTWIIYGLTFLIVIIFAGIYPAYNLATKKPLSGIRSKSGNAGLRRVLVVCQFVVAVVLIMVTITTGFQLEYIKKKNLGYEKENIFYVPMSKNWMKPTNFNAHYDAVKSELLQNSAVAAVTATSMSLKNVTSTYSISVDELNIKDEKIILLFTDKDFFSTLDIQMAAGRKFDGSISDASGIILNETAVKVMNIQDPIGKVCNNIRQESSSGNRTIIGVVKDFHFKDLHSPVEPLAIVVEDGWVNALYVKTFANKTPQAIAAVEKLWKQYEPELPFSYHFMDDEFDAIYKTDLRTGALFQWFAMIAIFVCCLGLFGLVTYTAETKSKEIGIRKVLGASVNNIINMLSKEFLFLVTIAMLFAFPIAYYWLEKMLQNYSYRININWWIFALTGIITLFLTLITVGWQAIKAATANPVKAIKSE